MTAPQPPRSPLGRIIINPMDTEAVKRDGWQEHGILVVAVDDPRLNWTERQVIEQIGNRFFGQHNNRRAHGDT